MEKYIKETEKLRRRLHDIPEASMKETETLKLLKEYISSGTGFEINDAGSWFYAAWRGGGDEEGTAFRADFDAVTLPDSSCAHLCGHDGHAAVLAVFGKLISERKPEKNIFLVFQPGEESGEGAALCSSIFEKEKISRIFGIHNIPGYPAGSVILRENTFACASAGVEIRFKGRPAHAAYPEEGNNPAGAVAELINDLSDYLSRGSRGMILSTVIGIECGSSSYGVSASDAVLRLTLRAEYAEEFDALMTYVRLRTSVLSGKYGLESATDEKDVFTSSENDPERVNEVRAAAEKCGYDVIFPESPFRWSEDFGVYLSKCSGALFGIGGGENCPPLHSAGYEYPDEIIPYALSVLAELI